MANPELERECIIEPEQECIIELAWVSSLSRKVNSAYQNRRVVESTIFRVPLNIREIDPDAYEPKIISFGPYHCCKPRLQAMNELKLHFVRRLLHRNPGVALQVYLRALKKLEKQARSTYSEDIDMESNDFVEMLLVDGCFIVELLLIKMDRDNVEDHPHQVLQARWALPPIKYDMLKLENQLPFFVLESIFELANVPNQQQSYSLTDLASLSFKDLVPGGLRTPPREFPRFHHLLHFIHFCIAPAQRQKQENYGIQPYNPMQCLDHLQSSLRKVVSGEKQGGLPLPPPPPATAHSIPCVTRLNQAGIKFRTTEDKKSFLDITFVDGVLSIPTLHIVDNTNSLFRNLIAFEQCYPAAGTYVAAYSDFMDSIIETPMDVGLLHQKGIIVNCLGNDDDAVILFNKLCKEVIMDNQMGYLSGVLKDVKRHCHSRWNKYRTKLAHDYFNGPWAIISLVAAVILLLFTAVQAVFAVLSYFNPPN